MKRVIQKGINAIAVIVMAWVILSFVNVNAHNMPYTKHDYWKWNFFVIISE